MKPRKVAMCLMAHPDDCEFLAAGTLALLAKKGWQIHIVTMTPGDVGSTTLSPEAISAIRRREGAAAAAVIGGKYHCLESRDLCVTYDENTLRRAMSLTREICPALVFTHSDGAHRADGVFWVFGAQRGAGPPPGRGLHSAFVLCRCD
jgi:LmbE family N-acetylglucosaminyl deacetylase